MSTANRLFVAALVGLSVGVLASQVSAQDNPARDAAIARCIKAAHTQYPGDDGQQSQQRTFAYKACMTAAGFAP